jgi:hypothetical protein
MKDENTATTRLMMLWENLLKFILHPSSLILSL